MVLMFLVILGGDGTLTSARDFSRKGVNVIGVPKTMDNDLSKYRCYLWIYFSNVGRYRIY